MCRSNSKRDYLTLLYINALEEKLGEEAVDEVRAELERFAKESNQAAKMMGFNEPLVVIPEVWN